MCLLRNGGVQWWCKVQAGRVAMKRLWSCSALRRVP